MKLYYVHDPMCSWCWAFRPVWLAFRAQVPVVLDISYIMGGLAADSEEPMPLRLQRQIQAHWHNIQTHVLGTVFNFEFWQDNIPRRSTYAACRAVIAARYQNPAYEDAMIYEIQKAYYLYAKNPSDADVLEGCAKGLVLDMQRFHQDMGSDACQEQLLFEMALSQKIGSRGFPSLILSLEGENHLIKLDYNDAEIMLTQIDQLLDSRK